MNTDLISYYKARAAEYEKIYEKPERQEELTIIRQLLKETFLNKSVLEIACGTGYWTKVIAETAREIVATDINESVLEIAKSKKYFPAKVDFKVKDIFNLKEEQEYESVFGGFTWSHIALQDIPVFINIINNLVKKGGNVLLIDNNYVEGSSLPLAEKDEWGNTYQIRTLEDGSKHRVMKNFPAENFLRRSLPDNIVVDFIKLKYYWILQYKTS